MPKPSEHKTVQARILKYAQEVGWSYVLGRRQKLAGPLTRTRLPKLLELGCRRFTSAISCLRKFARVQSGLSGRRGCPVGRVLHA